MTLFAASLVIFFGASPLIAQIVFDAKPTVRVDSAQETTSRVLISQPEQLKDRVLITKEGDRYFWASREGRELVHQSSGGFHYFIEPRGGGYIKIFDTHALPESMRAPGPRFRYIEHVTLGLTTITYWGESEWFRVNADQPVPIDKGDAR